MRANLPFSPHICALTIHKVPINSREFTVGRYQRSRLAKKPADYYIDHPACSLWQFKILVTLFSEHEPDNALFCIKDLNSTNGTFVNGIDLRKIGSVLLVNEACINLDSF